MENIFCGWQWGAMSIKNVVGVKTHTGRRIKNRGNTQVYQLGVKFTGRSEISYNGKNIDFCPGTALFLPKEETEDIDYTTLTSEGGNGVCIFFDSALPLAREAQILCDIGPECEAAFLKLLNVYTKSGGANYPEIMAAFYSLIARLIKVGEPRAEGGEESARFGEVIGYMRRHIGDEYPDIGRMAVIAGMSEKYFRESFKSTFDEPPLRYFHRLKTEHIKTLLADLDLQISEVAEASGFSDPNYFSRFFRKQTGISPSDYRKYYCSGL